MQYLLSLMLVAFTLPLFAEEAVSAVDAATALPWWGQLLVLAFTAGSALLLKYIRSFSKAKTEQAQLDSNKSLMEQKNFIIDNRLIPFALSTAEHWLTLRAPILLADAVDGNGFDWSKHWDDLKSYSKSRVLEKFAHENIDIIKLIGEKELDNLLDRMLIKLITKLPDNVRAFIPDSLVDKLTDYATSFIVSKGYDLLNIQKSEK